jgi:predicted nucleotidyltransferase
MMKPMTTTPTPLVSREALLAFTQRLVDCYAPERVILFGSLARGDARWDSDADILVVMPFEGRHLAKIREMRRLCPVRFPLDLLVRRPEEIEVRYRGGDPVVREALDHGEVLHGLALVGRSGVDCQGRGRLGSAGNSPEQQLTRFA